MLNILHRLPIYHILQPKLSSCTSGARLGCKHFLVKIKSGLSVTYKELLILWTLFMVDALSEQSKT